MQVGADKVPVPHPLVPVFAVVTVSGHNFAQRLQCGIPEISTAAVIFKTNQGSYHPINLRFQQDIADEAVLAALSIKIEEIQALHGLAVIGLIIGSQQLLGSAYT